MAEPLALREALFSFAPREPLRGALFLTYAFDGRWFDGAIVPDLYERRIDRLLVVRDGNAISSEASNMRCRRANAGFSRVFHPKLALLVAEDRARAVIGSANLTRSAFERQRELGRAYDLAPDQGADRNVFVELAEYLEHGVSSELRGQALDDLRQIATALRDVLATCKGARASAHRLLHDYDRPIWEQLREHVPKTLQQAVIVSPFYEADKDRPEDPVVEPDDHSVFDRLMEKDFSFERRAGEPPVRVFFRRCAGQTELPVQKLRRHAARIAFFAQDETERHRLHAKLLLLQGVGRAHEPLLFALHGSPNFTSAGLMRRPPHGNSELAVLTSLPGSGASLDRVVQALELEQGFSPVHDVAALKPLSAEREPPRPPQGTSDATYHVDRGELHLVLGQAAPPGAVVRIRLANGTVLAEATASGADAVVFRVPALMSTHPVTGVTSMQADSICIEVLDEHGRVVRSESAPLNVDRPQEFCGLDRVDDPLQSLDERIARAGAGMPVTYREQQKALERRKGAQRGQNGGSPNVSKHQADLDRFYKNVHHGLRGIRGRAEKSRSTLVLRRALDDLTRWAVEAVTGEEAAMTPECRLFMVDRLLHALTAIAERAAAAQPNELAAAARELGVAGRLQQVDAWLESELRRSPARKQYASGSRAQNKQLLARFPAETAL
jgi:hypothetical protein